MNLDGYHMPQEMPFAPGDNIDMHHHYDVSYMQNDDMDMRRPPFWGPRPFFGRPFFGGPFYGRPFWGPGPFFGGPFYGGFGFGAPFSPYW